MNSSANIVGAGSYIPDKIVSNKDVVKAFNITENHPYLPKGFKERRRMSDEETTSSMCVKASLEAIKDAGISPEEIDLIILATDTPDYIMPTTSAKVQHELGAINAGFFDVNASCAGVTVALNTAWNFMRCQEELKYVLVVGGFAISKYLAPKDIVLNYVGGDGAGAVILKRTESINEGFQKSVLWGEGKYWDHIGIYAGGSWKGFSGEKKEKKFQFIKFHKKLPAALNSKVWPELIKEVLLKTNWQVDEVDWFFFTQSKLENIVNTCESLNVPLEKSYNTMDVYGYNGVSGVPIGISDAKKNKVLKKGDKIVLCTTGSGMSYAAMTLIWS